MFIVIEGLDGAGKSTQLNNITNWFRERGTQCESVHFPRFDAPVYGELIAKFLRGELGKLDDVNPYLVALIYAGDRAEAAGMINGWLKDNKAVVLDRYVYSNIAFQCAKCYTKEDRDKLREWIFDLEYSHNKIPEPDLSIFLDVPGSFTKKKLEENRCGDDRKYLNGKQDIHESSLSFQERVREVYLEQAKKDKKFRVINCCDENGNMLLPEDIFIKIREEIEKII